MAIDQALVNRSRDHKDYPRAVQINTEIAELDRQIVEIQKRIDALKMEQDKLDPYAVGVIDYDMYNKPR